MRTLLSLALLATLPLTAADETFRWTGSVAPGKTLTLVGVNGNIEASPTPGAQIELVAVKSGRRSNPADVQIQVVDHADGTTICAVYPTSSTADRPNECRPDGGRNSVRDNDVQVRFTVRVPAGVNLKARTVNGGVTASGLRGGIDASTVNGNVRIDTTEGARAKTVNGSIEATMGQANWTGSLDFSTVNGGITLIAPGTLSTEVQATTVNGNIESDFPVTLRGRISPKEMNGVIGGGGRTLEMKTVNGSVKLRRAA